MHHFTCHICNKMFKCKKKRACREQELGSCACDKCWLEKGHLFTCGTKRLSIKEEIAYKL
jgi:hypothetical protein